MGVVLTQIKNTYTMTQSFNCFNRNLQRKKSALFLKDKFNKTSLVPFSISPQAALRNLMNASFHFFFPPTI